ncbi:hypothetical protein AX17_002518, partial [Amanita inopinata Kibby_2008]
MFHLQVEVAAALSISAFGSLVTLYFTRVEEGKIQLPFHTDPDVPDDADPFDVTTLEDIIDGYPIEEVKFWKK